MGDISLAHFRLDHEQGALTPVCNVTHDISFQYNNVLGLKTIVAVVEGKLYRIALS